MGTLLVIGTGKGLFIASRDDGRRTWSAPHRTAGAARLGVAAAGTLRAVLDEVGTRWPRLEPPHP